jgi:hypothetical protein
MQRLVIHLLNGLKIITIYRPICFREWFSFQMVDLQLSMTIE